MRCLTFLVVLSTVLELTAGEHRVFIGTYTRSNVSSDGIYTCVFDSESGRLTPPTLATAADNPSFLAVLPAENVLFACNETNDFDGQSTGAISAFRINKSDGTLTLINQQPTGGGAPCHCNIDATGRYLLVANYVGGNVAVFPIKDDGSLAPRSCLINHVGSGPNLRRQEKPHAHSINLSADNRFAYAADLGTDRVMIYRFDDQAGRLVPSAADSVAIPAGGGPRHFSIHPSGRLAYTNNELTCEITAFSRNGTTGALTAIQQISTLPQNFDGRKSTAECLVHPNGRFLFVSNRGHDSIAVYAINQENGTLTIVEIEKTGGQEPRNFVIDPTGRWLLAENQNSDTVVVMKIDATTGALTRTKSKITVGKPVCIRMIASGK
ncbi:MAG: lactonase family protein [Fuerstiella sp.]|nr:lactonase family protein [Fuerstiella sp.]MCP4854771.1 lactonase family protein [Fuerstiella sp.]